MRILCFDNFILKLTTRLSQYEKKRFVTLNRGDYLSMDSHGTGKRLKGTQVVHSTKVNNQSQP